MRFAFIAKRPGNLPGAGNASAALLHLETI